MRLTELAHTFLEQQLRPGDRAVDATAGNGHDTVRLAELVGAEGHVIAIDVQASAIESTRRRLQSTGLLDRCELRVQDHAAALRELQAAHSGSIRAVIFNLGYLPGSDKSVRTHPTSTLSALNAAAALLQPGGLLLVTAYRGHEGGVLEGDAVAAWMHTQKEHGWSIEFHEPEVNGPRIPPILWRMKKEKLKG